MTDILRTVDSMRQWRKRSGPCAAVLTMGALHRGHAALIERAVAENLPVVASIFVNPTQFASAQDLDTYPRTWDTDFAILEKLNVAAVFAPSVHEIYPATQMVSVSAGELGQQLEGVGRPGHFDGVLTIVNKLFNIIEPTATCFGEKDYQQLTLIRRMVNQLNINVRVIGVPTVRDMDGLALSSRNVRLGTASRHTALALPQALLAVRDALEAGGSASSATDSAMKTLMSSGVDRVEYLVVTDKDFGPVPDKGEARVLGAVVVDGVRLIDNIPVWIEG